MNECLYSHFHTCTPKQCPKNQGGTWSEFPFAHVAHNRRLSAADAFARVGNSPCGLGGGVAAAEHAGRLTRNDGCFCIYINANHDEAEKDY